MKKTIDKGFSLIELFVVMAVLAVLVLLASPWFGGQTGEAKLSQIKNDTKVINELVENYALKNSRYPAYRDITPEINDYFNQNKLYDTNGQLVDASMLGDFTSFKIAANSFVKKAANSSLPGVFVVTNTGYVFYLDKELDAPDMLEPAPEIIVSTTAPTGGIVGISINYPGASIDNQYKIGTGEWTTYAGSFDVSINTTIYAQGKDNYGIETDIAKLIIGNIDSTPPPLPAITTIGGDVVITYFEDSVIKEYKIGASGTWTSYVDPLVLTNPTMIYARATDVNGNVTSEVSAFVEPCGLPGDFVFDETTNTITDYNGSEPNLVIPDSFSVGSVCYPVEHIGEQAFFNTGLSSVEMPNTLKTIGVSAFYYNNLRGTVVIPDSVTHIYDNAFYGRTVDGIGNEISEVILGENLEFIGQHAFRDNKLTGTLVIPDKVVRIEQMAFRGESLDAINFPGNQLTGVVLGNSLEYIGTGVFDFNNMTGTIVIPDSIREIGWSAFSANEPDPITCPNNMNISEVVMGSGVEIIRDSAFSHNSLTYIDLPNTLQSIGKYAFRNNKINGEVVIPGSVVSIGDGAFNLNEIDSLVLNEGLQTIGILAFQQNEISGHIDFPNSLISIGTQAFVGKIYETDEFDNKITSVSFGSNLEVIGNRAFDENMISSIDFSNSDSLISIGKWAFQTNLLTGELVLPDSLVTIMDYAFDGYGASFYPERENRLSSVTFGPNVQTIGVAAFSQNELTGDIIIPNSTTLIADYAFEGYPRNDDSRTNQINSLVIGTGVQNIGQYAFTQNSLTGHLVIPDSVIDIGRGAFGGWQLDDGTRTNQLTSLTLGSSVQYIGNDAFLHNSLSGELIIPNSVIEIGDWAFGTDAYYVDKAESNQIESLVMGNSVQYIGNSSFMDNNIGGNLTLPNTVTYLGSWSFAGNKISDLTLPIGLTGIGESAFQENMLTTLLLPTTITNIGSSAFLSNSLIQVNIPNGVSMDIYSVSTAFKTAYDVGGGGTYTAPSQSGTWTKQ